MTILTFSRVFPSARWAQFAFRCFDWNPQFVTILAMFCDIKWTDPDLKHLLKGWDECGNVCIQLLIKEALCHLFTSFSIGLAASFASEHCPALVMLRSILGCFFFFNICLIKGLQFGQIHLTILRNKMSNWDKCILPFWEIQLVIWGQIYFQLVVDPSIVEPGTNVCAGHW